MSARLPAICVSMAWILSGCQAAAAKSKDVRGRNQNRFCQSAVSGCGAARNVSEKRAPLIWTATGP